MRAISSNIDQHPIPVFLACAVFIAGLSSLVIKLLRKYYWKTGTIIWFNKQLRRLYVMSERTKRRVESYDEKAAIQDFPNASKALAQFQSVYSRLEKLEFLKNVDTKNLSENILSNYFAIEGHLRMLSYVNKPKNNDEALKDAAAHISLGSLQA